MSSTCQLIDRTTGAVLFDLNDTTAANSAGDYSRTDVLATIDLGTPAFEFSRFAPAQGDGGTTTFTRAGFRQVSVPFRMRATSYDNLAAATNRLAAVVQQPCRLKWIANGSTVTRYIDVEPSPTPYFIDGRELGVYLATSLVDTPDGIELVLTTQPFWFGDTLDSSTNVITNATLLRDANADGAADGWTVAVGTWTIPATSAAQRISYNGAGAASLGYQQYTTGAGTQLTFTCDVRVISGTGGARIALFSSPALASSAASSTSTSTAWTRLSVTHTVAGGDTSMRAYIQQGSGSGTSVYEFRNAQMELGATATAFHVGNEAFTVEPQPTSGMARLIPVWNPGSAPTPLIVQGTATTAPSMFLWGPMTSGKMVTALNTPGANIQQIEDWTNGTDTSGSVQANSSPGSGTSAKLTTFATATMQTRATRTISTGMDVMRGRTWIPLLRIAAGTATLFGDLELWLDYGSNGDPVVLTAEIGSTGLAVGQYIEIPMGAVTFPDIDALNMAATLRAARTSGTGQLIWDCITWIPGEAASFIVSTASASMVSDPGRNLAYDGATIGSSLGRVAEVRGPLPAMIPPGLSLIYLAGGADWYAAGATDSPWGTVLDTLAGVRSLHTQLAPRYAV